MKKYIKVLIINFIVFLTIFCTSFSFAADWPTKEDYSTWVWKDMIDAYDADREKLEDVISNLDSKEASKWRDILEDMETAIMQNYAAYGQESLDKWEWLSDKLLAQENKLNTAQQEEENKDKTEEELEEEQKELQGYDVVEITKWLETHSPSLLTEETKQKWEKTIEKSNESDDYKKQAQMLLEGKTMEEVRKETSGDTIYTSQPHKNDTGNAGQSIDDVMNDAEKFVGLGEPQYEGDLANFSNTIYNILLAVGVVVAVIVGAIIGIKLMASNIETKVEAKKLLIPYVIGCIVVFGGFGIWKIVVTILQGM